MNGGNSVGKSRKRPVGFWILLGICAVATVALAVYLAIVLFFGNVSGKDASASGPYPYSEEEETVFFMSFDAAALSAVVCDTYPEADRSALAWGEDECFLRMTVEAEGAKVPLHFSLRSSDMTFTDEFPGYDRAFVYASRVYENVEAHPELVTRYVAHLEDLGCDVRSVFCRDFDSDGLDENILLVEGLMDAWIESAEGTDAQMDACEALTGKTVCVYLDGGNDGSMVVHSFCLPESIGAVTDAVWDNGMVHLVHGGGQVYRFFASESGLSAADYDANTNALRQICNRYAVYLEDQGYTDVRMRLADVSAAPGKEVLCCYSDGSDYTVVVYAVCSGRLQELYRKRGSEGSVYLVSYNGGEYLLDYSQNMSDDYSQTYAYCLFRFGEVYNTVVEDEDSLRVEANQGGGTVGSSFFSRVNGYLSSSAVCYDPYGLMGYTLMQETGDQESVMPDAKYLSIINCSTNKVGVVTLQDDNSFLNFRSGPSTAYDRVLINAYDPNSYVMQVQGALVTVIMPYNTGEAQNPIWAKIRINYQNRTLEGFSSQRYIRIPDIRHISVGESFKITVDTNDTGLHWQCSDPSVAAIGADGTLTGIHSGLVLITVTSDSGLEDSCLIMID